MNDKEGAFTVTIRGPFDASKLPGMFEENSEVLRTTPTARYLVRLTPRDSPRQDGWSIAVQHVDVNSLHEPKVLDEVMQTMDNGGYCLLVGPVDRHGSTVRSAGNCYDFFEAFITEMNRKESSLNIARANTRLIVHLIRRLYKQK